MKKSACLLFMTPANSVARFRTNEGFRCWTHNRIPDRPLASLHSLLPASRLSFAGTIGYGGVEGSRVRAYTNGLEKSRKNSWRKFERSVRALTVRIVTLCRAATGRRVHRLFRELPSRTARTMATPTTNTRATGTPEGAVLPRPPGLASCSGVDAASLEANKLVSGTLAVPLRTCTYRSLNEVA